MVPFRRKGYHIIDLGEASKRYGQSEYNYLVRVKTSITLPEDLLKSIDQADGNRSAFIERASRAYLVRVEKAKREANDIEIIDAHADRLNKEAMDVLDYQGLP